MRRDRRLVLMILEAAEHGAPYRFPLYPNEAQVREHVRLCKDEGLLNGKRLPWKGHDKLDESRRNIQYTGDPLTELPT